LKKVLSVSLGSSQGNLEVTTEILGEQFNIRRVGTDGDFTKACQLIRENDGVVDAIGLGGIDRYIVAGHHRYEIRDAKRLASNAQITPVVDGSGLKHTLERIIVRQIDEQQILPLRGRRTFLVSAVDRFGMAEALEEKEANVRYGDLLAFNINKTFRSIADLERVAHIVLPLITKFPFQWLYPTGKKQEQRELHRLGNIYSNWAELIAGDFHYIRRYLPSRIDGKTILTNTVRKEQLGDLVSMGAKQVITTTPKFPGGSFGTNVMEGVFIALLNKKPEDLLAEDYTGLIQELDWQPQVTKLND
jgi:hypothetical protein